MAANAVVQTLPAHPAVSTDGDLAVFLEDERVKSLRQQAQAMREGLPGNDNPVLVSDVISKAEDGSTLQWVQLVMAGGGMLGIAHVGFVYMLEEAGVRFLGLAGTSAGAINAGLIATVRKSPADVSWEETLKIMAKCDFSQFEDGGNVFVRLRQAAMKGSISLPGLARMLLSVGFNFGKFKEAWEKMGLHKGTEFRRWMMEQMTNHSVDNQRDLEGKMSLEGIEIFKRRGDGTTAATAFQDKVESALGADSLGQSNPLKLVASEVSTQSLVVFPEDAELFYKNPAAASPADYVRASMSVPIFFQPLMLCDLPGAGKPSAAWKERVGFEGKVPQHAVFVDGGTLSNFPIALFHDTSRVPLMPTFGAQLSKDRSEAECIDDPIKLVAAMNNSSRHLLDREFLEHNKDYQNLVTTINTQGFGWLDFSMTPATQRDLFIRGMEAAVAFLEGWRVKTGPEPKWTAYKRLRQEMMQQHTLK